MHQKDLIINPETQSRGLRIIVIEDEGHHVFAMEDVIRRAVQIESFNTRTKTSTLLQLVRRSPSQVPDLILVDLGLAHGTGFDVLEAIRAEPLLRHTLVVAVTGSIDDDTVTKCRDAGFNGFLGKPLDKKRLPDQIARILRSSDDSGVWEPR